MRLHLPVVGLVPAGEVARGSGVVLEGPEQPVEDGFSEGSAVGVVECATMADVDVALPRGDTRSQVLEVALALLSQS
jgi:hypothetical protein